MAKETVYRKGDQARVVTTKADEVAATFDGFFPEKTAKAVERAEAKAQADAEKAEAKAAAQTDGDKS